VFNKEEKWLNIRKFSDNIKRETYEKQNSECKKCKNSFEISQMEADHIKPWSKGGKSNALNCQLLCLRCNREKSDV
jgi:5-methylcytosine-specific restriction endonuclease McrA